MFTGLIEALGQVEALAPCGPGRELILAEPALAPQLTIGESVAVNGVCLTVVACQGNTFRFQLGPETLTRTNLGQLQPGDRVNLERALRVGDRLGGHFVQGHVDGVGTLLRRQPEGDWDRVWFSCPAALTVQMVPKGSIAVDGISLTLVEVTSEGFSVALIPHTLHHTTLGFKKPGDTVNLETDLLAKYVGKYLENLTTRLKYP
jgi:riboflavin synthase